MRCSSASILPAAAKQCCPSLGTRIACTMVPERAWGKICPDSELAASVDGWMCRCAPCLSGERGRERSISSVLRRRHTACLTTKSARTIEWLNTHQLATSSSVCDRGPGELRDEISDQLGVGIPTLYCSAEW